MTNITLEKMLKALERQAATQEETVTNLVRLIAPTDHKKGENK